jgi:hypothetical protein
MALKFALKFSVWILYLYSVGVWPLPYTQMGLPKDCTRLVVLMLDDAPAAGLDTTLHHVILQSKHILNIQFDDSWCGPCKPI